jgi:hypothetical protein
MDVKITKEAEQKILSVWDEYVASDQVVLDTKGRELNNIDSLRLESIKDVGALINDFQKKALNIHEFKSALDGYNKRNNLWGFTATKGQMFFNQLVKNEDSLDKLTALLQESIKEPDDLTCALTKIEKFQQHVDKVFSKAPDKRKVANPSSIGYFLSYFWQIHNPDKWPIYYTSLIEAFKDIDIWEEHASQRENYEFFFKLNDCVKKLLAKHSKKPICNWDAEHAFWNYKGNPNKTLALTKKIAKSLASSNELVPQPVVRATFNVYDYLIPKVADLVAVGGNDDKPTATKGREFEQKVAEVFTLLDFDVEVLGQGSGRNPDAIIKCRESNTAFIVDAKAYSKGYGLGLDDRAIKEYINYHCPKLAKAGYKKVGFIIVSNSFKSNFESFINEITWNTDIRRFILLTSEALLYLLAFKIKDNLTPEAIIEKLIGCGNLVNAASIIQECDDV